MGFTNSVLLECDGQTIDSRQVQFVVLTLETDYQSMTDNPFQTDNPSRQENVTMFNLDG